MVMTGCWGQTKPRPEIHLESESFTYYKEYAVGYSLSIRKSIYGKVRIVTDSKEKADLWVYRAKKGEVHKFNIRIVDHEPNKGEWQIVTKKGDEDFSVYFTDVFEADVSIRLLEQP